MKLLQLNAWMGRLTPQIVSLIQQEQPDIITAQEVFDVDGPVVFPDNMVNVFQQIQSAGAFEHTYFSPAWGMEIAHQHATFGNAIFSKFPLEEKETVFTHGSYNSDLTPGTRVENTRNAQFVRVMAGDKPLWLVNHHAHWELTPQGSETSVARMQIVRDKIANLPGTKIFAGDFNVLPGTPTLQLFDGMLEDSTDTYKLTTTLSKFGKVTDVACDHVLVSPEIHVQNFHVLEELVSDHKALLLEFDI